MNPEEAWKQYVLSYEIEVPEERIENELNYIRQEMRHRMQYDTLTGGGLHLFPGAELAEREEEYRAAAYLEAKSELVMKQLLAEHAFPVTREELEAEAKALAQRQNTTIELVKNFFGEDLALLERDLRERKARSWACEQMAEESNVTK